MIKYLQALNQLKNVTEASNETIAALINYQLTSLQIGCILEGVEDLATLENLSLVEQGILKACMQPIERLKNMLIEIKTLQSSINLPNTSA